MVNAGHSTPFTVRQGVVKGVDSTGLPLGVFCDSDYQSHAFSLSPGESLFLYTDGFSEAHDPSGEEYGPERLAALLQQSGHLPPADLISATLHDLERFRSGAPLFDDLTLMNLQRSQR